MGNHSPSKNMAEVIVEDIMAKKFTTLAKNIKAQIKKFYKL